jgi:hypothetical protein
MTNSVSAPKWFRPVATIALLWNLLGCAAWLMDVTLTADDVARMSAAEQAMYASRPAWAVGATAVAVWGGALGCLGLILRRRWSRICLLLSLAGVIVQDIGLFGLTDTVVQAGPVALVLQGVVLLVAIGLVALAQRAIRRGWTA